ncbi:WD repeat-containing protein on Y chromosome isoform X2 [Brienomyrus brachyistius]|uniref:WD repeat-containing protein on Y chromosome isoform X2 n=1 Tax=Brienomyrus brachyistius TaxID=42636 RepID=UPI0020B3718B|nr:WD repeat-containing protein on Y chromosome isoform X2 [Brienomyrus brachyistius]
MPLGKKVRATSALGRLETLRIPSVLAELGPRARDVQQSDRLTLDSRCILKRDDSKDRREHPEWLQREILRQGDRRHSVSLGNMLSLAGRHHRITESMRSFYNLKIEEKVTLENLMSLKFAFEEYEKGGKKLLDMMNFSLMVKKCCGLHKVKNELIQELFKKIDYLGNGKIRWDDFCTYMQLEYKEKEESISRSRQVAFILPASTVTMCHGEPIVRICYSPNGTVVTIREDGTAFYRTPELQLKKRKMVFQERPVNRKPKWATDFITMPQFNKLIIGTGDREIQFYEFSSLDPYCQIGGLETIPLKMDYCYKGPDECVILFGDAQGCVNIILMTMVGETLRMWKKSPKVENVPSVTIENVVLSPSVRFIRWKVHDDWVNQVRYFASTSTVISASNHEPTALVIGCLTPTTKLKQQVEEVREAAREVKLKKTVPGLGLPQLRTAWDQTVFSVYKGVKTFDFCDKHRLLVTGGLDRLIRMWNPYVPGKPTGTLKGHSAPIFYLCISSEDNRIFSVSMDNMVKIWDIHDQSCLFQAHPKASLIYGEMMACLYSSSVRALYVATDSISRLCLKTRPPPLGHLVTSHREPVLCCGYSEELHQVVSCSEQSVVKVWDCDTGTQVFEFGNAHGFSAISCLTFDSKGRRLITGARDGSLKAWNFNNGQCLKIFREDGESHKVCDCAYLTVNRKSYVMSVGWDRRIHVYPDSPEDIFHIQKPLPPWPDDLRSGHKDDILCMALSPPTLLATGSHDGEILVWNMVSGHLQCRILTPNPPGCVYNAPSYVDISVLSILFLRNRLLNTGHMDAACMVSSGARGYIHFWNVLNGGQLLASFEASRLKRQITKMALSKQENWLYVADEVGYISVFEIDAYALVPDQQQAAPRTVNYWRAHVGSITGLQVITSEEVLLTSSVDCTVHLWSMHGEFIGTFGQADRWSIHTPSSWRHPMAPHEVLIDPLSMPASLSLESGHQVSVENSLDTEKDANNADDRNPDWRSKPPLPSLSISDSDIENAVNNACYPTEPGKRLRHEIFKHTNKLFNHRGGKVYHSLKYFDIVDTSTISPSPDLNAGNKPLAPDFMEISACDSRFLNNLSTGS